MADHVLRQISEESKDIELMAEAAHIAAGNDEGDWQTLSASEQLAAGLMLIVERPDILARTGYSVDRALARLGPWARLLGEATDLYTARYGNPPSAPGQAAT